MNLQRMLRKKRVWIPLVLFVAYALFGFFVLPGILRDQIPKGIRANLGREARLERVRVNPLIFSLTLEGFELRDPDGTSFVAFKRLYLDLQATSLVRWAIAFRAFRLDGLRLNVRLMTDGKLNFQDLIKDEGGPPRIVIGRFQISDGSVNLANLMSSKPEGVRLAPIDLRLENFTTIPNKEGHYTITATDPGRGAWRWTGDLTFKPMVSTGVFEISDSHLHSWWQILKHRLGNLEVAHGTLACRVAYSASVVGDSVVARVDDSSLAIHGLALRQLGGEQDLLKLDTLAVMGVNLRYPEQSVAVGRILLAGGRVQAWLDRDTTLNLQRLFTAPPSSGTAPQAQVVSAPSDSGAPGSTASAAPWLLTLGELAVRDLGVSFQDSTIAPPFVASLVPVNITVRDFSSRPGARIAVVSDATIDGTGRLDLSGTVAVQPLSADMSLNLKDFPLPILQPYVNPVAKLHVARGTLGVNGAVQVREAQSVPAVTFQGEVESRGLMTRDRRDNEPFLGWKAFEVSGIDVAPTHVRIGGVMITQPFAKLLIKRDRTTNIQEILGLPTLDSTGTPIEPQPGLSDGSVQVAKAAPPKKGKGKKNAKPNQPKASETLEAMRTSAEAFPVQISKVEVVNGTADFADLSLILPFVARIEQLGGSVHRMSSTSAHRAAVKLDGRLKPSGTVHVGGDVNPWARDTVLDLRVVFNDFNMPALTPYAGQFIGREIDKGRMSLDLGYRLEGRHLVGQNKVVLDQLELGQKVQSPEATKLPVGLAIAILKDRNGKIDLDLPVEGDVDDPKFRIGKVIWDFIMSLLGKVATAPFALLGRLLGGGGDDELGQVAFEPGISTLGPDQQESVDKVAKALVERPQLNIELRGSSNDTLDAAAIRKAKFAAQAGEKMATNPKRYGTGVGYSQRLLEEMLVQRLGKKSLSEMEDRCKVAAGELDPNSPQYKAGSKRQVVNEAALSTAIVDTLTALQSADPGELLSLANARADVIKARLMEQGIEEKRVYLLDPAPGAIDGGRVRMDITLTD